MRFSQLDRITSLKPGSSIRAVRTLRAEEEYLKDHFPRFPVMPGVLMLEAMYQAAMWLVRKSEDFGHGLVVLKEARNVKFADFVEPGQTLVVTAELLGQDERFSKLKAQGEVDGRVAVSARLVVERYNLGDQSPDEAWVDRLAKHRLGQNFERLFQPEEPAESMQSISQP